MIRQYIRNWSLYLRGFRWLWTRETPEGKVIIEDMIFVRNGVYISANVPLFGYKIIPSITYKPGWTPLKFCLLVYWWDYGLATLLGRGVQSLSRAFQLFGQRHHWGHTGPILWGSKDLWKL